MDIFQFSFILCSRNLSAVHILFVSIVLIKYLLKNLTIASILFCARELFTELSIPGPAHSPPPLSCIATPAEDQAWEKSRTRGRVLPEGSPPPVVHSLQLPPRQQGLPHTELLLPVKTARGGHKKPIWLWSFAESQLWLCLVPCPFIKSAFNQ